eukprot:TRINITY_DN13393_c0_g1_i1.p1 TRINITY_DN13393_c0_g1~~TRINITY_DN13393_c0_g1_i1.p1  ORF type:complete len:190 (-),score=17.89 TRINITY_DN13393_c0_g1_i1:71-640(-)
MAENVTVAVSRIATSLPFIGVGGTLTLSLNGRLAVLCGTWTAMTKNVKDHKDALASFDESTPEAQRRRVKILIEEGSAFISAVAGHVMMIRAALFLVLAGIISAVISAFLNLVAVFEKQVIFPSVIMVWFSLGLYLVASAITAIELQMSFINLRREGRYLRRFIRETEHELMGIAESPLPGRAKMSKDD